ncbi:ATP-binding protein [Paucibacter sp. R3-3]|uniref:histidine kinase n=1 Tax=Roseateles agri TaxID=3098619 RepID=A0ABU5DPP5_9BURK|nr:ATP-binding protein [Paucibacter sp. R3-3]MDY0747708.1 ATP-binding protein [Paucibacter sp. R3-3]
MPRNTAVFAPTFGGEGIVRSADITQDPRYGHNKPHAGMPRGHLPVRSYLAVPVISRSGAVIGGLFFGHSEPGRFTEDSERSLSGLAGEAAVAIDNVRLNAATQTEIVERRRAEAALRELNADLEQLVWKRTQELNHQAEALRQSQKMEALGQLTGGIAHDFNNLLQVVIGNLDILGRTLPEELVRQRRAVALAMSGAKRSGALTQRLLAFARQQPLDPKPISANRTIQGMADLLRRTLGETVEWRTTLTPELWTVEADPGELENALLNLAVNARDAMPNGGKLTIETANVELDEGYASRRADVKPGAYAQISVSDSGTGMDAATVSRAFDPFFTTKAEGKGTGLGLSQVYGFVRQSHGHVTLYSEPGSGTTVHIYLPRMDAQAETPSEQTPEPAPLSFNEVVLVVEDDADVRTYSVEVLEELGYRVVQASDAASALQVMATVPVDLLFTDVVLPGGTTGAVLANRAREMRPELKVLFTSGYARDAIVHHGRLDRGVQLLPKPFGFDDLAIKIREVLDAEPKRET